LEPQENPARIWGVNVISAAFAVGPNQPTATAAYMSWLVSPSQALRLASEELVWFREQGHKRGQVGTQPGDNWGRERIWVVVSNIFYFYPYLGK